MGERIFVQGQEGQLDSLGKESFSSEEELQKLLATRPELLVGEHRPSPPQPSDRLASRPPPRDLRGRASVPAHPATRSRATAGWTELFTVDGIGVQEG